MVNLVKITLSPEYIEELQRRHGDVHAQMAAADAWLRNTVSTARASSNNVESAVLAALRASSADKAQLPAFFTLCELATQPQFLAFCSEIVRYLLTTQLSVGARYQLAAVLSTMGLCARRPQKLSLAIQYAQSGIELIEDLPPRELTANLYHNLSVALEDCGNSASARAAFEKCTAIDTILGINRTGSTD